VDGLEKELTGTATVIRLDATKSLGREIAWRYAVTGVPTLLVLDGQGELIYRQSGPPSKENVLSAVANLNP